MSYFFRKVGFALLTIWGVVTLLFIVFNVLGDPSQLLAGQRTDQSTLESIQKKLGLDLPIHQRYFKYLNDISPISVYDKDSELDFSSLRVVNFGNSQVHLKLPYFNRSFQTNEKVSVIIFRHLPGTIILTLSALFIATIFGIWLGAISAKRHNSTIDRAFSFIAFIGVSAPSFFVAVIFVWLFSIVLHEFTSLPAGGYFVEHKIFSNAYTYDFSKLILPSIALGIRPLSVIYQLTRSSMLNVLRLDYIRTARAKGLSEITILYKHAFRNALNPVFTAISGWFASLLAGTFFIEYIFDWQGIGKLTIDALNTKDYPVILACVLFVAIVFVIVNVLSDIIYRIIDPRIK